MSALGRLSVLLSLDSAEFTSGLSDAQRKALQTMARIEESVEAARNSFLAYSAAATAAAAVVTQLADQASQYQDVAEKIGDSATQVASLKTAADVAGFSLDSMSGLINKLSAALGKTDDESTGVRRALQLLGINLKEFEQLKAVDRVEALAKAFSQFEDGPEKSALAIAALGKSGADALPFFNDLVEVGRSQYQLTEQQIAASVAYTEQLARVKSEVNQLGQAAAGDLAPALSNILTLLDESIKYYRDNQLGIDLLKIAMNGLTNILQTVLVVGSDVAFVFAGVGREIGGIAAQIAALARGDLKGFSAISDAMKEDAARARAELDKFQASVLKERGTVELYGGEARLGRGPVKGKAPRIGGGGGAAGGSRITQEQKDAETLGKLIDDLNAKSSGFDSSFYKNFDLLNDALDRGKLGLTEFNRLQALLIEKQPGMQEAKRQEIDLAKARNAEFDAEFERIEKENALTESRIKSARESYEAIQFETTLIGLNSVERLKAITLRQLEAQGVKKGTEAYEEFAAKIGNAIDVQEKTRKAQQEFEGLSNGITQALRGNGDAVKQLVDQMINEFLRLQVVEPILQNIFGSFGGGGGGGIGGGLGSFLSSVFSFEGGGSTGNGPRSGGLDGKGGFLAMVHPKEQINDLTQGNGGGGTTVIHINNTIGSVASQEDVVKGMVAVRQQIRGELGRSQRMGGAFA
jgi:hypothetical protein